jgi:hypothetical protein
MARDASFGDGTGLDKLVTRVVEPPPKQTALEPLPPATPIAASRGEGRSPAPARSSGASTGADWTETSRTYWADKNITSSDGMFTIVVKPLKKVSFTDGGTGTLHLNFLNP